MEFFIPKSFKLLGRTYKVLRPKKIVVDGVACNGLCESDLGKIKVEKELTPELAEQVFLHETTHAILDSLGYDHLSSNEQFVDSFSNALYQVIKTAK